MISLLRIIKFACQDMARNLSLSLMTVFILVLMLLSVNTLVGIRVLTFEAVTMIEDQIDVSIYFDHEANEEEMSEVQDYVASFPEVTEVDFQAREDVLEAFKEEHKENKDILAALDELDENPLGATMIVKTREPGDYQKVISALNIPEYEHLIEAKTFADTERAISRISDITVQVERFSIALTALFAVIAFLIIWNTIRVAIYTQRVEISIKKLVGASNWFVRGPYVIESLVFSILSVLITTGIVYGALRFLDPYIAVIFHKEAILTNTFLSNILLLFGIQFCVVFLLTIISSTLAMRKHLRV